MKKSAQEYWGSNMTDTYYNGSLKINSTLLGWSCSHTADDEDLFATQVPSTVLTVEKKNDAENDLPIKLELVEFGEIDLLSDISLMDPNIIEFILKKNLMNLFISSDKELDEVVQQKVQCLDHSISSQGSDVAVLAFALKVNDKPLTLLLLPIERSVDASIHQKNIEIVSQGLRAHYKAQYEAFLTSLYEESQEVAAAALTPKVALILPERAEHKEGSAQEVKGDIAVVPASENKNILPEPERPQHTAKFEDSSRVLNQDRKPYIFVNKTRVITLALASVLIVGMALAFSYVNKHKEEREPTTSIQNQQSKTTEPIKTGSSGEITDEQVKKIAEQIDYTPKKDAQGRPIFDDEYYENITRQTMMLGLKHAGVDLDAEQQAQAMQCLQPS